jgi:uncharacterized protein
MSLTLQRLSLPTYARGLRVLALYLDKAAAHAAARGIDEGSIVNARLAADMLPLSGQVQRASDTSKNAIARLLGVDPPRFEDNETTLAELKARVERTLAYVVDTDGAKLDAGVDRQITLAFGAFKRDFSGEDYVLDFALPNFHFHVAMTHAILRHLGVEVGKLDYLGATL